ncbi:MAG: DNA mismatch repair protein MutS [Planctomycetaceae bacterium]|jgi:DNA mismatch repair protein MutS|nr:DNA mismatch repair protein MutS [Planctomycetaceae bacterium]
MPFQKIQQNTQNLSPMMKQFYEAKRICPEALLLFRMGDFYEMFFDDAKTAAKLLGLALTSREKGPDGTPMAGFPHHQLDSYIAKIIAAGYRAAVCEQMEDPKQAKGIVKRAVTRIVTAGTVTDETLLDPKELNYLAAVCYGPSKTDWNGAGIAWVELSTGAFYAAAVPADSVNEHLARIAPSELVVSESGHLPMTDAAQRIQITKRPDWTFNFRTAYDTLLKQFQTATLEGFGFTDTSGDQLAVCAAGAALDYLNETQRQTLVQIDSIQRFALHTQLEIDEASRRSLEITRTIRGGKREGSLLGVLDRCVTPMGARYLSESVAGPLLDIAAINGRLDAVEELYGNDNVVSSIREQLRRIYDLQRMMTRILQKRGTPRDLSMIGRTLRTLPFFRQQLADVKSKRLADICNEIDPCSSLTELLESALADEITLNIKDGGFIRSGFNAELDELRLLQKGGKQWIADFQAAEIRRSGISSLKVGYTSVFGYYIEITNVNNAKIPENYIRKQTLKNAERYITPELKEYEEKVLSAAERAVALEMSLLAELCRQTGERRQAIAAAAKALAALDVIAALASLARERGYCRPVLVKEPVLNIIDGRHPVLDALEPAGTFVPNDTVLDEQHGLVQLITGPNMSGKSTFIRQTALLCIMAQLGSFIPAKSATVGICDRIFARVGASDEISRGQSTFMVEMTETARILNQAGKKSLVILDEIGRGTSTYDGMSLAWSITEYLHGRIGCRTLFATHYHELTDLADVLDGVSNLNVAVREHNGDVAFLHKIVPGSADKSYGIHVAKLAGVPKDVVERASELLESFENKETQSGKPSEPPHSTVPAAKFSAGGVQFSLFGGEHHPVLDDLRRLNIDTLKPLEALQLLADWKREL